MSMLRNRVYYRVKPFIPQFLRTAIRRRLALRLRDRVANIWPIMPGSERLPENWPGWPEGKKFALVLTHDVESAAGLGKCRRLMQLEMELGFRSSFNFIPEGSYRVPRELREELSRNRFEVGIHDLKHDGRLFASRRAFRRRAARINSYLRDWNAVGFRSGFMLHELDWLHELDIQYDTSTFDTDPFEPQPEGRYTIFPFWVAGAARKLEDGSQNSDGTSDLPFPATHNARSGYVELPYTLPQDSTLFLLLRERTTDIWVRKLDWIAEHGGMALVNIHPDYVGFDSTNGSGNNYPAARIYEFLNHVVKKFGDAFWNPSCSELSSWYAAIHRRATPRPLRTELVGRDRAATGAKPALAGKRAAVLLYSYYPADPRPRRAAEALVDGGMHVDLICLRGTAAEKTREVIRGVHVVRLPLRKRRHNKRTYILQYATFLGACFGLLSARSLKKRYDLVHVHNMPDILVFGALIPKLLGARIVLDLHDPMPELMMSIYNLGAQERLVEWLKRFEKYSISFADLVLTPNKAFRELFISRGCPPGKIEIIMNSPEAEIFHSEYRASSSDTVNGDKPFKIMYHGLIAERHGLDTALEAIAQLRSVIPALEFHIFGNRTGYLDKIETLIRQLGLDDYVHYHGYQPQTEIARNIRSIDLGVIPNRRNPFTEINMPTRIFEYLAMGKPVVVPDTLGIRDYFGSESALFFEPDDPRSLSDVILQVYGNPQRVNAILDQGRSVYEAHRWEIHKDRLLTRIGMLVSSN